MKEGKRNTTEDNKIEKTENKTNEKNWLNKRYSHSIEKDEKHCKKI